MKMNLQNWLQKFNDRYWITKGNKMSRLHDMGGRFGDGLIPLPRDNENEVTNFEPTFKYKWHAKAWAITLAAGALGEWN